MDKQYQPSNHEPAIRQRWEAAKIGSADPSRVLSGEKKPYAILIPPPNVTGQLHLGHALNNTLQDTLIRAHRMMGYEALWMAGTDHAGIATQAVVEKRLRADKLLTGPLKDPAKNGGWTRDKFIAKVQEWKDEYEARITEQLTAMGCSCDWDRQRFTMDEVCAKAVREAFFRLFRDGLIYRGKRLVNWDPILQTAVADDECYEEELDTAFYYMRYPLVRLDGGLSASSGSAPVTWKELGSRGYPLPDGANPQDQAHLTVATTRPETYLADTAIGVSPHDPRAKALKGLHAQLPFVGRIIPIIEDDYVVLPKEFARTEEERSDAKAEFATGFLKVTPGHDQNDYDLYMRHKEAIDANSAGNGLLNMMAPEGRVSDQHGWTDTGEAKQFVGKKMLQTRDSAAKPSEARTAVVEAFKAAGLLDKVRPYKQTLKFSERSNALIEPFLSDQWYVKVTDERLAPAANAALVPEQRSNGGTALQSRVPSSSTDQATAQESRATLMQFYPARYAKTFEHWHTNIRDWCISRQLWWGHRIPVWSRRLSVSKGVNDYPPTLSLGNLAYAFSGEVAQTIGFAIDTSDGRTLSKLECDALCKAELTGDFDLYVSTLDDDYKTYFEARGFTQDPDVLDTWFSSALWPMSTMGWPDPAAANLSGLLEAFNPSSVLSTAREIITLWVSRMVMFNRYLMPEGWPSAALTSSGQGRGPIPFHDVFIHAVVQDGQGRKMSKSLGNGVDPLDIIESHGSDAMRFTLCQMTTQTQDVRMPVQNDSKTGKNTSPKFDLGRNFANKIWNAARFAMTMLEGQPAASADIITTAKLSTIDRWMLSRLTRATAEAQRAIQAYEFSEYAQSMYDLVWRDFCDWYLEAIKPTVATDAGTRAVLLHSIEVILRLLHPMMPFVTEAIYTHIRELSSAKIAGVTLGPPTKDHLLALAPWPVLSESLRDPAAEAQFAAIQDLVGQIREARAQHNVLPKRKIVLHATPGNLATLGEGVAFLPVFAGLERIDPQPPAAGIASVTITYNGQQLALSSLADAAQALDTGTERERLQSRIADLEKSAAALLGRLNNPGYLSRAPANLVQQTQDDLAKVQAQLAQERKALEAL